MTKHFRNQAEAETDLIAHGFRAYRDRWIKSGFIATFHPVANGSVMVAYQEVAR